MNINSFTSCSKQLCIQQSHVRSSSTIDHPSTNLQEKIFYPIQSTSIRLATSASRTSTTLSLRADSDPLSWHNLFLIVEPIPSITWDPPLSIHEQIFEINPATLICIILKNPYFETLSSPHLGSSSSLLRVLEPSLFPKSSNFSSSNIISLQEVSDPQRRQSRCIHTIFSISSSMDFAASPWNVCW